MSGRDRDRTRKRRGGNPNRPSQIARERAGLSSQRDYPQAFEGRNEAGELVRSEAPAGPAPPPFPPPSHSRGPVEPSSPPPVPLAPPTAPPPGAYRGNWRLGWYWEEDPEPASEAPEAPVREVFTSEVRAVPKRRSRSPLRRSVPEPRGSPKRPVPEPRVGPKKKKVVAEVEEIQEEPVASGPSSGSGLPYPRPAPKSVVIRPAKRKAESPRAEAKKKAEEERKRAEEAEAEAKKKADKEARLEAKKKAEAEDRKKREIEARRKTGERPLIALDWHRTLSFEDTNEGKDHGVSERSAEVLRGLQDRGFDLCVISFASSPETQRRVIQLAAEFEVELNRPFVSVDIVNRKFLSDQQRRPSVSGLITCKAEQVSLRGAFLFIDDQVRLLEEVQEIQRSRADKHKCIVVKAEPYPRTSLLKLSSVLLGKGPDDFPVPSLLSKLCSEALRLFAAGKLRKGG